MADRAERPSWWPWVVGVLLLVALAWALSAVLAPREPGVTVEEAVPDAR